MRFSSVFIFLWIGFFKGPPYVNIARQPWRIKMLIPLLWWHSDSLGVCHVLPVEDPLLLLGQEWWCWLQGAWLNPSPWWSFIWLPGNYRKMTALYWVIWRRGRLDRVSASAMNYGIIVGSFDAGELISAAIPAGFIPALAILSADHSELFDHDLLRRQSQTISGLQQTPINRTSHEVLLD